MHINAYAESLCPACDWKAAFDIAVREWHAWITSEKRSIIDVSGED
jgi:hypothetical protein